MREVVRVLCPTPDPFESTSIYEANEIILPNDIVIHRCKMTNEICKYVDIVLDGKRVLSLDFTPGSNSMSLCRPNEVYLNFAANKVIALRKS